MRVQLLENEFSKYWLRLSADEKESLLTVAKNYVHLKKETNNTDLEQYNAEIDKAVKRVEEGEFYTHEEVLTMAKEW